MEERKPARGRLKSISVRRFDVGADVHYGTDKISAVFGEDGEWQVVARAGRASSLFLDQALVRAAGLASEEAIRLAEAIHDRLGRR